MTQRRKLPCPRSSSRGIVHMHWLVFLPHPTRWVLSLYSHFIDRKKRREAQREVMEPTEPPAAWPTALQIDHYSLLLRKFALHPCKNPTPMWKHCLSLEWKLLLDLLFWNNLRLTRSCKNSTEFPCILHLLSSSVNILCNHSSSNKIFK